MKTVLSISIVGMALLAAGALAQPVGLRYFYDDADQLFRVLDSTGNLVEYTYDPSGNIIQVTHSTVAPSALSILNVVPLSGPAGQTVTIYGQNFATTAAGDTVQFGGIAATVTSASSTVLTVQIPPGFTSGQVTVTVNGVTVNSGDLAFAPPPAVTSITPSTGTAGQTLTGVVVQGTNLSGATFSLSGGGTVTPVAVGNTQATLNVTVGLTLGPFVIIATAPSGIASSSQPMPGNIFFVFNTAGNNYSDTLFSVFNATGPTPNYPAGTNHANQYYSTFNPLVTTGTVPVIPPGSNESDQFFSVFNPLVIPGTTTVTPAGSNEAWQLYSEKNNSVGPRQQITISIPRAARSGNPDIGTAQTSDSRPPLSLVAGQSAELTVRPPLFLYYLELDAENAPLASSTTGWLELPLTAPFGVDSLDLRAFGYSNSGPIAESSETVRVLPDPGRTITGQVTDASGAPVGGAVVTWQAQGLEAEYYRFGGELRTVPDLMSGAARMSFLGALNYPNPQQVFGADPMGVGLGRYYAARLRGKIQTNTEGIYQFALRAHAGARLTIDGQLVAEAAAIGADAVVAEGSVNLTAGAHEIEVTHFESGGAAALQLLWTPPGGVQTVVPPNAITSEAHPSWRVVTGSDGRFELHVPAALDGVVVKLAADVGSVRVDQ